MNSYNIKDLHRNLAQMSDNDQAKPTKKKSILLRPRVYPPSVTDLSAESSPEDERQITEEAPASPSIKDESQPQSPVHSTSSVYDVLEKVRNTPVQRSRSIQVIKTKPANPQLQDYAPFPPSRAETRSTTKQDDLIVISDSNDNEPPDTEIDLEAELDVELAVMGNRPMDIERLPSQPAFQPKKRKKKKKKPRSRARA